MAATTLTELWELAATMMGATYATEIISAASPTTPLELTMAQTYDQIRVGLLRRADWQFARRYETMIEAPKIDPYPLGFSEPAATIEWDPSGRFSYIYREPPTSIKFRGFQRDWADTNYLTSYTMRRIPLSWVTVAATTNPSNGLFTYSDFATNGHYIYASGGILCEFTDTFGYKHVIRDDPSASSKTFTFVDETGGTTGSSAVGSNYGITQTGFTIDTNYGAVSWNGTYPTVLPITVAIRALTVDAWNDAIFTDISPDVHGVYTVDVTDPTYMPEEFQMALAAELAFQAGVVHAKSTKQLSLLQDQAQRFFSEAVGSSSAEEDHFDGSSYVPTAEQARR